MNTRESVQTFLFPEAGPFPNNPRLPLVIYSHAFSGQPGDPLATEIEKRMRENGWDPAWRYGVYSFPHYHSTAHEFLGVYCGHARLRLGHTSGQEFTVKAGDVVVLPAGLTHQNLGSSDDFHVVGGYPRGQTPDLLRGHPNERPAADERIALVQFPSGDPLFGGKGPLVDAWNLAKSG